MTKPAETGWLIEHPLDPRYGRESWYSGKDGFTLDSLLAIRYARKEDALREIDRLPVSLGKSLIATEHAWVSGSLCKPATKKSVGCNRHDNCEEARAKNPSAECCHDGARFARDRYEAREKLWREYRDLLLEEVNAHVGLAVAHGWAGSPERYARGKTLRAALGIDKERA